MDILLLVAATATSVGVDWPGDFTMDAFGRLERREERKVAPFVYAGVGIIKPELFKDATEDVFRLAPYFDAAAAAGNCSARGSMASGSMSARCWRSKRPSGFLRARFFNARLLRHGVDPGEIGAKPCSIGSMTISGVS